MIKPRDKKSMKPTTLLAPLPVVLVSCHGQSGTEFDKDNLITLAWAGTVNSDPPMVSISIRKSRFSHQMVAQTGEFVINLVSRDLLRATDFCGVKSGRDLDKFAECQLTAVPAEGLNIAPAVAESPLTISCKVRQLLELGSHDCFIGEIVAVQAAKDLFDSKDELHLDRANLVAFSHGKYYGLDTGQNGLLGFFGYSVASKAAMARRMPKKGTQGASKAKPAAKPKHKRNPRSKK